MEIGEEFLLAPSLYFLTCLEPSPDKGTIVKVCVEAFTVDKISLTFFFLGWRRNPRYAFGQRNGDRSHDGTPVSRINFVRG